MFKNSKSTLAKTSLSLLIVITMSGRAWATHRECEYPHAPSDIELSTHYGCEPAVEEDCKSRCKDTLAPLSADWCNYSIDPCSSCIRFSQGFYQQERSADCSLSRGAANGCFCELDDNAAFSDTRTVITISVCDTVISC